MHVHVNCLDNYNVMDLLPEAVVMKNNSVAYPVVVVVFSVSLQVKFACMHTHVVLYDIPILLSPQIAALTN